MKLFSVRLPEELIIKLKVFAATQETTVQVLAGEFITKGLAAATKPAKPLTQAELESLRYG